MNEKKEIGIGEILSIREIDVAAAFHEILGPESEWHSNLTKDNWALKTNEGNALLRSNRFRPLYESLLRVAAAHMGSEELVVQKTPTFRIQLPGTKSVSFHTDDISSGHGKNIINFWLPLNDLNDRNCMYLLPEEKSRGLLKKFVEEKLSLEQLDKESRNSAEPCVLTKGQMVCFSNKILHGTVTNDSRNVRISLDFRCLLPGEDLGSRVLGNEYVKFPFEQNEFRNHAVSVIFQNHECHHIGHGAQRAVVTDTAQRLGLRITRETSEWHHLNHFPVLDEILSSEKDARILLFSQKMIDWQSDDAVELLKRLEAHPGGVYFCLEGRKLGD